MGGKGAGDTKRNGGAYGRSRFGSDAGGGGGGGGGGRSSAPAPPREQTHYATLGVAPTATAGEIKKAYLKLALKTHPDKNKAPGAEEAFKQVNKAKEILTDASARQKCVGGRGGGGGATSHRLSISRWRWTRTLSSPPTCRISHLPRATPLPPDTTTSCD